MTVWIIVISIINKLQCNNVLWILYVVCYSKIKTKFAFVVGDEQTLLVYDIWNYCTVCFNVTFNPKFTQQFMKQTDKYKINLNDLEVTDLLWCYDENKMVSDSIISPLRKRRFVSIWDANSKNVIDIFCTTLQILNNQCL